MQNGITYSLSLSGFSFSYTEGQQTTILTFDPAATCDLFQAVGFIEDFTIDHPTGEPVILWTAEQDGQPTTGFCFWCELVNTFTLRPRFVKMVGEYLEYRKVSRRIIETVDFLLSPLQPAA